MSEYTNDNLLKAKNSLTDSYRYILEFLKEEDDNGAYDIEQVDIIHTSLSAIFNLRELIDIESAI